MPNKCMEPLYKTCEELNSDKIDLNKVKREKNTSYRNSTFSKTKTDQNVVEYRYNFKHTKIFFIMLLFSL